MTTEPVQIWKEFTTKLQQGTLEEGDCWPVGGHCFGLFVAEPVHAEFRQWILSRPLPGWEYGEDKLLFFADRGRRSEVRFDFIVSNGRWYFYTVDGITIPVKSISSVPFSDFPVLDPWQEAFGRREGEVAFVLRTYLYIRREKGRDAALAYLDDGKGYRACALAWVPYFELRKAFVVLMGWREKRHHGEDVVIEHFTNDCCVVTLRKCMWLQLYDVATQFRNWMPREEYWEVFEHIWRCRARANGWQARFEYEGPTARIVLTPSTDNTDSPA